MRVLNDFLCTHCGITEEHFLENETKETTCLVCGGVARKVLQPIRFSLPGNDPSGFPTAYDQWAKKRDQKIAEERKAQTPES